MGRSRRYRALRWQKNPFCVECMAKAGRKDQRSNESRYIFEVAIMKKKCTASGCRKIFRYNPEERVICPHCGKEYPGLRNNASRLLCNVDGVFFDLTPVKKETEKICQSRPHGVKYIRGLVGKENISLRTAVELVDYIRGTGRCPVKAYSKASENGGLKVVKSVRIM